ncbi:DEAD-domain-containing protein [Ramicandelaber brevisporus]|nr:DEAD-domain-containing protein [Ramicandelaber brevisporus]
MRQKNQLNKEKKKENNDDGDGDGDGDEDEDSESENDSDNDSEVDSDNENENENKNKGKSTDKKPKSKKEAEPESDSDSDEEEEDEETLAKKKAFFAPESSTPVELGIPDSFTGMNLSRPILKGLNKLGFVQPTPIQARTIPVALLGKDICGGAITGSGKTAAMLVPTMERLLYRPKNVAVTRVLVLCPTRELAVQFHSVAVKLASFTDIKCALAVGGLKLSVQEQELRMRPDIVIATPGRLIDHLRNSRSFDVRNIDVLIMDEADRMLEEGFKEELSEIIRHCPKKRQTMLFSATMTDNVDELIRLSLNKPVRIQVDSAKATAKRLIQEFIRVRQQREEDRPAILYAICRKVVKKRCIIFFRSKAAAHQMKILLGLLGISAGELHGDLTQEQRLDSLEQFRDGRVDFMLATDLAARGIDIQGVEGVINYNMPTSFAQYQHRVGRTARANRSGVSVTLVGENDRKMLKMAIKNSASADQVKQRVIPPETISKYKKKIEVLSEQVKEILQDEKTEKQLRQAEMEVKKAQNLLDHSKEIQARPKRTWFQSNEEKDESKKRAGGEYAAKVGIELKNHDTSALSSSSSSNKKRKPSSKF